MTVAGTLAFAFGAGLTTVLSPCAVPLLPGYAGYVTGRYGDGGPSTGTPLLWGLVAAAGVLAVFAALAAGVVAVGRTAVTTLGWFEPAVGVVLVALGLAMLAGRAPSVTVRLPERRRSVLGVAAFGGLYAVAAAGCTVPVVLAVVAGALTRAPTVGAAAIGVYAVGVALPIVGVTVAVGHGLDVASARLAGYGRWLERVAGVVVVAAGVGQLLVGVSG